MWPRERGENNFCLAYTGLRVDDITAARERLFGARASANALQTIS